MEIKPDNRVINVVFGLATATAALIVLVVYMAIALDQARSNERYLRNYINTMQK